MNVKEKIYKLKKEKNAVILAHYYQQAEVQDMADFIGDSLQLSREILKLSENLVIFAGVYFMAETAKILNPEKKIIIPDKEAGCSLVDSVNAEIIKKFKEKNPDYYVVCYINSSAEVKAYSDIICTSSNAIKIINSIPREKKILFIPDKNLGKYLSSVTGREIKVLDGVCIVHEQFSLEKILELKKIYDNAKIIAHPECKDYILKISDFIGSTSELLNYVKKDDNKVYIVATEPGILHQMRKVAKDKLFIPAPPEDSTCACSECKYMKMITVEKLLFSLENEKYEVILSEDLIEKAKKPIVKMLELS